MSHGWNNIYCRQITGLSLVQSDNYFSLLVTYKVLTSINRLICSCVMNDKINLCLQQKGYSINKKYDLFALLSLIPFSKKQKSPSLCNRKISLQETIPKTKPVQWIHLQSTLAPKAQGIMKKMREKDFKSQRIMEFTVRFLSPSNVRSYTNKVLPT